jgi:hypothetical protein
MFGDYLAGNENSFVTLFVLRAATDTVRAVSLEVSQRPWGITGQTGVGLTLAQGHLHQMPAAGSFGVNDFGGSDAEAPPSLSEPVVTSSSAVALMGDVMERNGAFPAEAPQAVFDSDRMAPVSSVASRPSVSPTRSAAHWSNGPFASPYPAGSEQPDTAAPAFLAQVAQVPLAAAVFGEAAAGELSPGSHSQQQTAVSARTSHHLLQPSSTLPAGAISSAGLAAAPAPKSGWFR